jgi:hypothetical protein
MNELVTIPGLHDGDEWTRFEAARRAISQRFGNSVPASRYRIQARRSAWLAQMGPLGNKAGLTKSRDMLITSRHRIQELKSDLLMKNTVSRLAQE